MATSIRIATGNVTAQRSIQNDAKAQAILIRFADSIGATGTPAEKLLAVVDWCIASIQAQARDADYQTRYATTMAGLETDNKFDVGQ
jgi:hypothetical protein